MARRRVIFLCALVLLSCAGPLARAAGGGPEWPIDFTRDVRPILSNRCFRCHGPDKEEREGGLRLDTAAGAVAETDSGSQAIVPGDPDESELLRRITSDDEDERMPPAEAGARLTEREVQLLTEWIQAGAPYAEHWSYGKPVRPELPDLNQVPAPLSDWPQNEVDQFILDRLAREGLAPSPQADRATLIRRVWLDLVGLPPSREEVDRFLADADPQAYEQAVDRALAHPGYGEHWARQWLDLARYADSAGYADDPPRTIWAYRDWVIRALNANQPFDQFTVEQLAGDLLPDATPDQLTATAFHRNTLTNNEGGTNDEEFRNVAVVDRVNTTLAVWMGTTINCCQCHNHKYDPLTQEEFFRLFAIFNNTQDADRKDEAPVLQVWSMAQRRQRAQWESERAELQAAGGSPPPRLAELDKALANMKPETSVPVMRETEAKARRKTFVQRRGNFLDLGPEVTEGVPAALHPLPADQPANRLALARWLVDEQNPLTARVIANRYWETIFGRGIVVTSEEFGAQGELPTHPQLLDWLATELIRSGWDTKALLRLLVTSATYRQTSRVTPELLARDPENVLLARGPRVRLSAEMVRDQALALSGLLSSTMYGPSVNPPQPKLGVKAAFGGGVDWTTSEGENRYRRAIYTTWRRSNPYPSMATFDAPNREVCTIRRARTNTPLQALVTLNDPVYFEAAQALARAVVAAVPPASAGDGQPADAASVGSLSSAVIADRAHTAFRRCLLRQPNDAELQQLVQLYQRARERLSAEPDNARRIATQPLGPAPEGADLAELAAWTVVSNALLNLDEMLMKP